MRKRKGKKTRGDEKPKRHVKTRRKRKKKRQEDMR